MTEDGVQEMGETGFNSRQPDQDGINLRDIDQRIEEFVEAGVAEEDGDGYVFYAEEAGYDKVLGGGELRKDIEIHAGKFSGSAEEKIEESNGEAVKED